MVEKKELIKQIRLKFGYNKLEFSRKLKITYATIFAWETGSRSPSFPSYRKMVKLAKEEGVDIDFTPLLNALL